MENIKSLLKCKHCDQQLKNPLKLPCGVLICKKDLIDNEESISCKYCNHYHLKSIYGYPPDKRANEIINLLEKIQMVYSLFETLNSAPQDYIDSFVEKLKNSIDLKREMIKYELETESNNLIEKIDNFHNDPILEDDKWKDQLNNILKNADLFLRENCYAEQFNQILIKEDAIKFLKEIKDLILIKKAELEIKLDEEFFTCIDQIEELKNDSIENLPENQKSFYDFLELLETYVYGIVYDIQNINNFSLLTYYRVRKNLKKRVNELREEIIKLRNNVLNQKGYQFEKMQFMFPELEYFKNKNHKFFTNTVNNISSLSNMRSKIINREKHFINYIPIGLDVRFHIDKYDQFLMSVGLSSDFKYEYSSVFAPYTVRIKSQTSCDDIERNYIQHLKIKIYLGKYKKVSELKNIVDAGCYNSKNDSIEIEVNVCLEEIKPRKVLQDQIIFV